MKFNDTITFRSYGGFPSLVGCFFFFVIRLITKYIKHQSSSHLIGEPSRVNLLYECLDLIGKGDVGAPKCYHVFYKWPLAPWTLLFLIFPWYMHKWIRTVTKQKSLSFSLINSLQKPTVFGTRFVTLTEFMEIPIKNQEGNTWWFLKNWTSAAYW